ncbi:hypothetical protein SAMN05216289_11421 [Dokdonella immobilis]|uniref:Uncharacterized protein n=1 Tax=Dokdonella immobilis TaxID=578942 RepID=A0A1I4Y326_9GAMM|nr:hypothetical protein SAMN05216289_11421 [Dokdonella immobilis]
MRRRSYQGRWGVLRLPQCTCIARVELPLRPTTLASLSAASPASGQGVSSGELARFPFFRWREKSSQGG